MALLDNDDPVMKARGNEEFEFRILYAEPREVAGVHAPILDYGAWTGPDAITAIRRSGVDKTGATRVFALPMDSAYVFERSDWRQI